MQTLACSHAGTAGRPAASAATEAAAAPALECVCGGMRAVRAGGSLEVLGWW